MNENRSLTLALGGGGVKCFTHLGVLKALEDQQVSIAGIAGTSAGALVAALVGTGYSADAIIELFSSLDIQSLSRRTQADQKALFGLSRWRRVFDDLFGDQTFEDMRTPIALPVVNLDTNSEEVLATGRIADALMAAIAIPGIFPPQEFEGRKLIDGGVLNPVPVSLARSLSPDLPCCAVLLTPTRDSWHAHPFPRLLNAVPWMKFLGRLRYTQALAMYVQAADLTNRLLAEIRLEQDRPDIVIRPDVNCLGLFDRVDIEDITLEGERAAVRQIENFYA